MFNVLYHLQLYLRDYIRAAMMCIKFYQMGARNYSDLYLNLKCLRSAKDHLQEYLQAVQRRNSSSGKTIVFFQFKIYMESEELFG